MKKIVVIFFIAACMHAATTTIYSDWGWGYYFWLFGWVGPSMSEGVSAAGYSSSIEYRGFNQFSMTGWPGPGTTVSSLALRLCNNTGGAGLSIDINRVTSATPSGDECGEAPPVYLTSQPVNPIQDEYSYFSLPGSAISDFQSAWESGAQWFGLGYLGTGPMHFFYGFWADDYLDAALFINYTIGVEETGTQIVARNSLKVYPNPFRCNVKIRYALSTKQYTENNKQMPGIRIYDASGRCVKSFSLSTTCYLLPTALTWDGTDKAGRKLPPGVYFCEMKVNGERLSEKIIKTK